MRYITFFLLWLLIVCSTCEKNEEIQKLRVKNNSSNAIYAKYSSQYPDTSLLIVNDPTLNFHIHKVPPNSLQKSYYGAPSEGIFKTMKSDILLVFIFDAETLESTPWDTVVANYMILKRYELTLSELNNMNWIVPYP
jgi:hypothetical protein